MLSESLETVFEESSTGILIADPDGRIEALNPAAAHLFGVDPDEVVGQPAAEIVHGRHLDGARATLAGMATGSVTDRVVRFDRRDGTTRWARARFRVAPAPGGERPRLLFFLDEVTEDAHGALAEVEQRLAVAFDNAPIGMATVGLDGRFLQANQRMCSLIGYREAELAQLGFEDVTHPADRAQARVEYERLLAGEIDVSRTEKRYVTSAGETVWVRRVASAIRSASGEPLYMVIQVEDMTEERRVRDELSRLAYSDPLTGLANRAALLVRTEEILADRPASLLLVDLDDFKKVNDTLGHDAGDRILVTLARRLGELLEPEQHTLARLGGDEFVIADRRTGAGELVGLGERIIEVAAQPFDLDGRPVYLSASVGIATGQRGARVGEILRQADLALYTAKRGGKARAVRFSSDVHAGTADLDLEAALRRAVADGSLAIEYQPVHRLADGALTGVEALCRWNHPQQGPIPPDLFIALAERCGLIHDLGVQIVRRAVADIADLAGRTGRDVTLAVNVSPLQLGQPAFAAVVADTLSAWGFPPDRLTMEITETAVAAPGFAIDAALAELRQLGVRLALDDFGTGYSSLGRLRTTPFDVIKIDRSFVAEITRPDSSAALAAAAVALGHALGARVVAEGIETDDQLQRMRQLGCDYAQGYLLGRPRPLGDLEQALTGAAGAVPRRPARTGRGRTVTDRPLDADALIRELLGQLQESTGLESVFLTRIDWRQGLQRLEYVHNAGELSLEEGLEVEWTATLCRRAFLRGTPVNEDTTREAPGMPGAAGIGRHIAMPVTLDDGTTYGTLCGASRTPGPVAPEAQRSFARGAGLIAHYLTVRTRPQPVP